MDSSSYFVFTACHTFMGCDSNIEETECWYQVSHYLIFPLEPIQNLKMLHFDHLWSKCHGTQWFHQANSFWCQEHLWTRIRNCICLKSKRINRIHLFVMQETTLLILTKITLFYLEVLELAFWHHIDSMCRMIRCLTYFTTMSKMLILRLEILN